MSGTFRALLIANWLFPADTSGRLPTLTGAQHDAEVVEAALTHADYGLFTQVRVVPNETVTEIKRAIRALIDNAETDDTLLLYYSGHGQLFDNHLYLSARDTDGEDVYSTGLAATTISDYIAQRNRARSTIVVLDCCYAGAFGEKGAAPAIDIPSSLAGEGMYVLSSSRRSERARDAVVPDRPSPFTEALAKALTDPSVSGGLPGFLTIQQVYEHLYGRFTERHLEVRPEKRDHGRGSIPIAKRVRAAPPHARNYSRLQQRLVLSGGDGEIFCVAVSPDCKTVAAGTDGGILLWRGDTEIWGWDPGSPLEPGLLGRGIGPWHESYVYSVAFSPDGASVASGDEQGRVFITALDGRLILEGAHHEAAYGVAFSPDGLLAASGGWDRRVVVWDVENSTISREISFSGRVSSVAFSPVAGEHRLAISSLDNSVLLWDIDGGVPERLDVGHASSVESVAFSPDGSLLASCGLDKSVRVWDVRSNRLRWAGTEHEYLVRSIAFAPDGETLVSAGWDKTMNLWNAATGVVKAMPTRPTWHKHDDWIWSVTFSPDGRLLASGSSDGTVIIWSLPA